MDPALIQTLSGIGLTGGLIVAVWAFQTGKIVTAGTLAKTEAACERRLADQQGRHDGWSADIRAAHKERTDQLEARLAAAEAKYDASIAQIATVQREQNATQQQTIAALHAALSQLEVARR